MYLLATKKKKIRSDENLKYYLARLKIISHSLNQAFGFINKVFWFCSKLPTFSHVTFLVVNEKRVGKKKSHSFQTELGS